MENKVRFSELRVGNYVNFKNREDIDYCEINELSREGCHLWRYFKDGLYNDDQPEAISDLTGIHLNIAWLVRLGFELYKPLRHYRIVIDDIWIEVSERRGSFWFSFTNLKNDETQSMPSKRIKYVHRLQNLFFEVIDEELKIRKSP